MSSFGSALAASALFALVTAQANNIGVVTEPCLPRAAPTQSFTPNCAKNACQYASISSKGQCITSAGFLDELYLSTCDPSNANQSFVPNADGSVSAVGSPGNCWNVDGGSGEPSGTPIILYSCGSLPEGKLQPNDIFTFVSVTGGRPRRTLAGTIYVRWHMLNCLLCPPRHHFFVNPFALLDPLPASPHSRPPRRPTVPPFRPFCSGSLPAARFTPTAPACALM